MKKVDSYLRAIVVLIIIQSIAFSINAQSNSDGSSPQFLFPDFQEGTIRMRNGNMQDAIMNYNMVTEKMVYQKNEALYDMTNIDMIDTINIENRKFVPFGNVFYEVIFNRPVTFFKQHKGTLIPPGTPAGYGGTSQVSNTKYMSSVALNSGYYNLKLPSDFSVKSDPLLWIRHNGKMFSFINEKQFLKIFPGKEENFKKFIKEKRIKFGRINDIVSLAEYANEIVK
jgi:hypothetical protein